MACLDGITNKIDPTKEGFGPYDVNIYDLPEEDRKKVKDLLKNLEEALNALQEDHGFLLKGGVFNEQIIKTWIKQKSEQESNVINKLPHPAEFALYYDF